MIKTGKYVTGSTASFSKTIITEYDVYAFAGDTITAKVTIESIDDQGKAVLKTQVEKSGGELVIDGRAKVILPD